MQNNYDFDYIKNLFNNEPNFEFDAHEMMDTHFRSLDTSEVGYGQEVFSLSRKLARFLLHNCKHQVPNDRQIKKILRLKAHLDFNGMKDSWTNKPIVLNNKTREIEDGVTRLYAVALGKSNGVYMPMLLKDS